MLQSLYNKNVKTTQNSQYLLTANKAILLLWVIYFTAE